MGEGGSVRDEDPFARPEPKPIILDTLSVVDLENRIATLREEIERCEALIASKRASRDAANAVFGFKS